VEFTVSRREGPPPRDWNLLWQVERDALVDATRELYQRLAALERSINVLHEMAYRDALTGLLNRRGIHDRLDELAASYDSGSLAFVDLDDLRELNAGDELWEDGDKAIAGVATSLHEGFGRSNVGRWGGDEYLIVAPGKTPESTAELLRGILEDCKRELVIAGRPVTFSAGVVACTYRLLDDARDRAQRLVKEAKDQKATIRVS
jgi:diguanylate cyclase (GGDEF)-like protein